MADADRLVELFKEASKLDAEERDAFVRKVREEDSALAASLNELLGQEGPADSTNATDPELVEAVEAFLAEHSVPAATLRAGSMWSRTIHLLLL